jgi:4-amino-4-deoxy-L-arabinose transferase-like glycosyltransferase
VALFSTPQARQGWAYRLPSLTGAVVAVLLTARIGSLLFGATSGIMAGLLLAACVLLSVEARMATIDGTLLAVVLAAQSGLLAVFLGRDGPAPRWGPAALFWAAIGVGLMLKGPVIALVSFGTIVGLIVSERCWRWLGQLRPAWGVPLMLAIVLPWCVAIAVVSHGNFFANSVGTNFLGKVAQGQQAHGFAPGYYLALFPLAFWPGSLFAVFAVPFAWANRRTPQVRFLLAWIVPTWLIFEIVATKLPHYVLPTYPAIACLTAAAMAGPWRAPMGRAWRWVTGAFMALWVAIGLGLAVAGPIVLWRLEHRFGLVSTVAGVIILPLVAGTAWFAWRRRAAPALACALPMALLVYVSSYGFVLPELQTIWLSPRIAAAVAAVRPCPDSVVASSSFSEPSLVFALGQQTKLIGPAGAADHLAQNRACGLALIDSRDQSAFLARMEAERVTPRPLTEVRGINYSTGKKLDLTIYAAAGGAPSSPERAKSVTKD